MFWRAGAISKDKRAIGFDAPRDGLPRDRPKRAGGKAVLVRIDFRLPHHFANLDNDLGKRESTFLLCRYLRPYRESKPLYEGEQLVFVRGDKGNRWR
jgi:hypothetical protein